MKYQVDVYTVISLGATWGRLTCSLRAFVVLDVCTYVARHLAGH